MSTVRNNQNTPAPTSMQNAEKPKRKTEMDGMFIASMVGCGALFLIFLGGIGSLVNDFALTNKQEWLSVCSAFASSLGIAAGFLSTFIVADYLCNKDDKQNNKS